MNKQFAELKVFELGGIAFCEATETLPFLVLPKGQATIKPWGPSGFVFENIITGDVVAFVSEYDDILDSAGAAYGATQLDVITALAAFFFELGGGAAGDLANVLIAGNTSGANDIIFDAGQGLQLDNFSRLREGTIDAGTGGVKGIAQICGAGYELKWEAGVQYVMGSSGNTIRISLYNFNNAPTVNDDNTKGYYSGSRWALDNGTVYVCSDATTGAAVWAIQQIDYLDFNTAAAHTVVAGELAWNNTDGTLDLGLKGGNVTLQIGQEQIVRVVNKTATNVNLLEANYQVVRITGAQGQRLKVDLALATTNALSAQTIGVVTETINDNQEGFITVSGLVRGINTTGSLQTETWADGDIIYLSPTTAGNITNVKPIAPNHLIVIGYVVSAHITQGSIYVKVDNGYELDELHNVTIATPLNNDVLTYETSSSLWKNKRLPTEIQLAASDETTALTAGTAKVTFRMPYAMTVTEVRASLTTAQASGSIFTVDINEAGTSILSTKLTIDNTEKTSTTAATPAVISDTALADDAEITIDIDQIGNGTATGLKITIIGTR
jgi:hypothetical protein